MNFLYHFDYTILFLRKICDQFDYTSCDLLKKSTQSKTRSFNYDKETGRFFAIHGTDFPEERPAHSPMSRSSLRRDGNSKKVAQALRAATELQDKSALVASDPMICPPDGIYTPEHLCSLLKLTRQALGYHMNQKDEGRKLRFFKRAGDKTHYVTAVELYRWLTVHGFLVPRSVHLGIQRFNHHYGEQAWQQFLATYQSELTTALQTSAGTLSVLPPQSSSTLTSPGRRHRRYPQPPPFNPPVARAILQEALTSGKPISLEQAPDPLDKLLAE